MRRISVMIFFLMFGFGWTCALSQGFSSGFEEAKRVRNEYEAQLVASYQGLRRSKGDKHPTTQEAFDKIHRFRALLKEMEEGKGPSEHEVSTIPKDAQHEFRLVNWARQVTYQTFINLDRVIGELPQNDPRLKDLRERKQRFFDSYRILDQHSRELKRRYGGRGGWSPSPPR